jgi:hypothetical protein
MSARIIPFPPRRCGMAPQRPMPLQLIPVALNELPDIPRPGKFQPFSQPQVIRILREDAAWLVTCRGQAWLHGSHDEALRDAFALAAEFNLPVTEGRHD